MPFSPRGIEQTLVLPPRWPLILYTGTLYEAQVTQFNHLNYEITPSNLFSVPSTIDGLIIDHRDMDGHPQQNTKETW